MEKIELFNYKKLKENIDCLIEGVVDDYDSIKQLSNEEKQKMQNEFDELLNEIEIIIHYEIDNDSELAAAVVTIYEKYIEAIKKSFSR